MTKLVTAKLILQVGSLQFMEAEGLYIFGKSVFYWKFKDSSTYYGPFNTLIECGEHVDEMMRGPGPMPEPTKNPLSNIDTPLDNSLTKEEKPNNLITVDFKSKRRL